MKHDLNQRGQVFLPPNRPPRTVVKNDGAPFPPTLLDYLLFTNDKWQGDLHKTLRKSTARCCLCDWAEQDITMNLLRYPLTAKLSIWASPQSRSDWSCSTLCKANNALCKSAKGKTDFTSFGILGGCMRGTWLILSCKQIEAMFPL